MADSFSLADLLDRAGSVFSLTTQFAKEVQEQEQGDQLERGEGALRPTQLTTYDELRGGLEELNGLLEHPPEGFTSVAHSLRDAKRIIEEFEEFAQQPENEIEEAREPYSQRLGFISEAGFQALKQVAATLFTLLDRYPDTPRGHMAFLEFVRDEVRDAAKAKENQLERGYSNATIENTVSGIKWREAGHRLLALTDLPELRTERIAHVLRRELTPGNLEQIEELLTPAVNALASELGDPTRDLEGANLKRTVETDPVTSQADEADADFPSLKPELQEPDQLQPDSPDEDNCGNSDTPFGAVVIDQDPASQYNCLSMKGTIFDLDIAIRASGDTPERIREWPAIRHQLRKRFGQNLSEAELWERCIAWIESESNLPRNDYLVLSLDELLPKISSGSNNRSEVSQRNLSCADADPIPTATTSQQTPNDEGVGEREPCPQGKDEALAEPWLGAVDLAKKLGVLPSRLGAFRSFLRRNRCESKLQDSDWIKVKEVTGRRPQFLYLSSSPRIVNLAKDYR